MASGPGQLRAKRSRFRFLKIAQRSFFAGTLTLYEPSPPNTIVDELLSRDFRRSRRESGFQEGIHGEWLIKEIAKRKIARARRSARDTAASIFGSGKPARCPRRGTRPAPSRNAANIAMAPQACATNTSRPSTASPPTPRPQQSRPKRRPPKLRLPDTATAPSRPRSRGQRE